ncbi:helix-turn-helix transcriptional regulator [Natrarchaeobaculum aegyptiacum]|uniref:PadR family transcriptional regulator n=1 Tax=Natrarchaeobaculum aegyptiacum TaxID=745377 RepID=A0A2Z2HP73_9EURY|nr:helix-turn-helix transcriptional regulator [Natrarchaeobaculum aegyptiacum]ARS88799.1 PadR family transcriptional regulator [Natrarchaeobaculum aegyptiacum]
MSTRFDAGEGTETRELLHFLTQETRFSLLANVLGHPEGMPSMYELEQLNPSVSEATVYKHVQKLVDAGVLEAVTLPEEQRQQGYPWKFYRASDEGREFLERHNLLAAEETLEALYGTIEDKPEKMVRYENAPRPDLE